ncbi:SMC3 protein [Spironucleus salmonicida]|uniref:SMC3 protein n=1 Tax=Spironucleus salmonicida TaxID=348837 RepID=V6LR19_9EUKA|nr:SMC3 protein [Spironucleus salmonicida]|eukprot:EST46151.1 SMC3 protein [Spironucleus salmonicida]
MYISTLQLKCFKQFQDILLYPHHGLNFIIGNNGEGKSNILEALQCLTVSTNQERRISLIQNHYGSASIYYQFNDLDIVKNYSDQFEELFLNGTKISFPQLQSQLEYYGITNLQIIKQSDVTLIKSLQDLYAVKNFDQRQKENRNLLLKSSQKHDQIKEKLIELDMKVKTLQNDKAEFTMYLDFQHQKQRAEATVIYFDLVMLKGRKIEIDQLFQQNLIQHDNQIKDQSIYEKLIQESEQIIEETEQKINQLQQQIYQNKQQKDILQELLLSSPDYILSVKSQTQNVEDLDHQILQTQSEIQDLQSQLQIIMQQYQSIVVKLQQFNNSESLDENKSQIQSKLLKAKHKCQEYSEQRTQLVSQLNQLQIPIEQQDSISVQQYARIKSQLYIAVQSLEKQQKLKQNQMFDNQRAVSELNRQIPGQVAYPIQYIQKLLKSQGNKFENKIFGPLYQLLSFDKSLINVIDAAIGMSLFNIVVDTEEAALQIIDLMTVDSQIDLDLVNAKVNFLPLSNFKVQQYLNLSLPDDSVQLSSLLSVDDQFQTLIQCLFGRVIICKNLQLAKVVQNTLNLDCFTIDGDSLQHSGLVVGGYRNTIRVKCCFDVISTDIQLKQTIKVIVESKEEHDRLVQENHRLQLKVIQDEKYQQNYINDMTIYRNNILELDSKINQLEKQISEETVQINSMENQLIILNQVDVSQTQQSVEELKNSKQQKDELIQQQKLKIFQSQKQEEFLLEKQQLLNQKKNQVQIQLDVQLQKVKRQFSNLDIPSAASPEEAMEIAQRRNNDLQQQIRMDNEQIYQLNKVLQDHYQQLQQVQYSLVLANKQVNEISLLQQITKQEIDDLFQSIHLLEMQLLSLPQPLDFPSRADAVCFSSKVQNQLLQFKNINKLSIDQFTLLKSKFDSSSDKFAQLTINQMELSKNVEIADQRFNSQFDDTLEKVKKYYKQYLKFLLDLTGDILTKEQTIELVIHCKGSASAGQQAAARAAYILALQANSPILILDEVDAHLDQDTKLKFGQLLQSVSQKSQIFCVSFCKEILSFGDKIFQVAEGNVNEVI